MYIRGIYLEQDIHVYTKGVIMYTSLAKWGNSYGIRIPKKILEHANITSYDELEIVVEEEQLIIKKAVRKNHITLKERVAEYDAEYKPEEINWGKPVGKEIW